MIPSRTIRGLGGRLKHGHATRRFASQRPAVAQTRTHNAPNSGQNNSFFTSANLSHSEAFSTPPRTQRKYATLVALTSALLLYGAHTLDTPLLLESPPTLPGDDTVTESQDTIVDPATSLAFPKTLRFQSPQTPPLSLLGLGVRTVSFLSVKVYAVGFYADISNVDFAELPPDQRIDWLIQNRAVAVRLVPTRNTSFHHLRDAYVRSLHGRLNSARTGSQQDTLTDAAEADIEDAVQKFKGFFSSANLVKSTPFYLLVAAPDTRGRELVLPTLRGRLRHTWTGVELMRAYFQEAAPSPAMKSSVFEGVGRL